MSAHRVTTLGRMQSEGRGREAPFADWRPHRQAPRVPRVEAEPELVVEEATTGFCGAVVRCDAGGVVLEDRHRRRRVFPLLPAGFLIDGRPVTLTRPRAAPRPAGPARTASGSIAVPGVRARVARAGRIYVEGIHDAALVERIWGDDLRIEGVVVEPLHGIDDLPEVVRQFRPGSGRRLGVLVDHLVAGSKESRLVASVTHPDVLVTGHPYVDVWQAVKPAVLGMARWPEVPRGTPWKQGVCAALGASDVDAAWRTVLAAVDSYADLETPLLGAVERLIDFVTAADADPT